MFNHGLQTNENIQHLAVKTLTLLPQCGESRAATQIVTECTRTKKTQPQTVLGQYFTARKSWHAFNTSILISCVGVKIQKFRETYHYKFMEKKTSHERQDELNQSRTFLGNYTGAKSLQCFNNKDSVAKETLSFRSEP